MDQAITDPISGPSFDFTFSFGPELDNLEPKKSLVGLGGGLGEGGKPNLRYSSRSWKLSFGPDLDLSLVTLGNQFFEVSSPCMYKKFTTTFLLTKA